MIIVDPTAFKVADPGVLKREARKACRVMGVDPDLMVSDSAGHSLMAWQMIAKVNAILLGDLVSP